MDKNSKIYIAGHTGLVGAAIIENLKSKSYKNLILKTHHELDLISQSAVKEFFETEKPEYVFLAAAKVGGILANKEHKAEFIYENLMMQSNIIHNAYKNKVKKLLFLASSCIYPKLAPQPIQEESLLTGPLEKTNDAYAVAKIAGIKMCQSYNEQYGTNFISVMPTNLYGPNDNFDLETSHVLPALIRKFYEAKINNSKSITLWGTGKPEREFLHVNDLADACVFLMEKYDDSKIVNIGTSEDISIKDLAELIKKITRYEGIIKWDTLKPDGAPKKQLSVERLHQLGWRHKIKFTDGLKNTYEWYVEHESKK